MDIGCYAGCDSTVIGQCQGHVRRCGRFYCASHSIDRLCTDCSADLGRDNEAERRYRIYDVASRAIVSERHTRDACRNAALVCGALLTAALVVQLSGIGASLVPGSARALLIAVLAGVLAASLAMTRRAQLREQDMRGYYANEPGFQQFVATWERQWRERTGDEQDLRHRDGLVNLISSALYLRTTAEARPAVEAERE